jgi:hypothetical protein
VDGPEGVYKEDSRGQTALMAGGGSSVVGQ